MAIHPDESAILYDAAKCAVKLSGWETANEYLKILFKRNFKEYSDKIQNDKDFDRIWFCAEFNDLLNKYKKEKPECFTMQEIQVNNMKEFQELQ
ncbi:hypothetical protein QUF70_02070 [Desulfobacterales bacterium HSG17]|nr:hypothetical protein [Desulfobacterales bacterium HSG17]